MVSPSHLFEYTRLTLYFLGQFMKEGVSMNLEFVLNKLKKPSVLLSLVAQAVAILTIFNVNVDMDMVGGLTMAVSSILVTLGIMSDPNSVKKGFGDDIFFCPDCKRERRYVKVGNSMVCSHCSNKRAIE